MALDEMTNGLPPEELKELKEEMQNSTSEEKEELFALRDARRKDT